MSSALRGEKARLGRRSPKTPRPVQRWAHKAAQAATIRYVDGVSSQLGPARHTPLGPSLRILSYNIQVGIPYSRYRHYLTRSWKHVLPFHGRQANLDSIAQFICGFDIIGLQELDAGSIRSNYVNQARYLARQAGFPYWYAQTNRNLGRLAQHSLGLLSALAPAQTRECKLPGRIPGRGALLAVFGEAPEPLAVVIVHLALGRKARRQQLAHIASLIEHYEHVVVMGDFNCRIDDLEFQALLESTHLCSPEREHRTYPSWRPKQGLDHILVTPELQVEHTRVFNAEFSDHLPIAVEIRLPASMDWQPEYHRAQPRSNRRQWLTVAP